MGADDALVESTREGSVGDEEIDGLNECFNQLSATTATILRDQKSCTVQTKPSTPDLINIEGEVPGFGDGDQLSSSTLSLEGYDEESLIQVLDQSLFTFLEGGEAVSTDDALAALGGDDSEVVSTDDALAAIGGDDSEAVSPDDALAALSGDDSEAPAESPAAPAPASSGMQAKVEKIRHLNVGADVILAERQMDFEQLLTLNVGSVVEFWKPCDEPADLSLGNSVCANGEIVISSDQHFGLRVLELAPEKRVYQKGIH
ncbi:MAG: FliM/FliN family flagellar motor switch protein, partial [Planctomycetes bacterium]|nr:FliM/FliN family flagellar motor switch protein [Planctomycetota bacterium]